MKYFFICSFWTPRPIFDKIMWFSTELFFFSITLGSGQVFKIFHLANEFAKGKMFWNILGWISPISMNGFAILLGDRDKWFYGEKWWIITDEKRKL